jgi:hypothetical protein
MPSRLDRALDGLQAAGLHVHPLLAALGLTGRGHVSAGQPTAGAGAGSPSLGVLVGLALLAAVISGGLYLLSCRIWQYGPCLRCALPHQASARGGGGRSRGSRARRWGTCRKCGGTGRRIRPGARLLGFTDGGR